MKNKTFRLLTGLLTAAMTLSSVTVPTFAAEIPAARETPAAQETPAEEVNTLPAEGTSASAPEGANTAATAVPAVSYTASPAALAFAQEKGFHTAPSMEEPVSVAEIFDEAFYAAQYPDVAVVYGTGRAALLKHYMEFGAKEGRLPCAFFDVVLYRNSNPDLNVEFGDNWDAYVEHYYKIGRLENRSVWDGTSDAKLGLNKNAAQPVQYTISAQGIVTGSDGSILVPADVIESNYLTMEQLYEICGDSLILITDSSNRVLFVGGQFTDSTVSGSDDALSAMDCMMDLLGVDTETRSFVFSRSSTDSLGNVCYRFVAAKKDSDLVYDNTDYILTVDKDGGVLSLSASSADRMSKELEYGTDSDTIFSLLKGWAESEFPESQGWTFVSDVLTRTFIKEKDSYVYAVYLKNADGRVVQYTISTNLYYDTEKQNWVGNLNRYYYSASDLVYDEELGTNVLKDDAYANDFYFLQTNADGTTTTRSTELKSFVDYYGNVVQLPCAYEEGKGWYICDTSKHIIGMTSANNAGDIAKLTPLYFTDAYFTKVQEYSEYLDLIIAYPDLDSDHVLEKSAAEKGEYFDNQLAALNCFPLPESTRDDGSTYNPATSMYISTYISSVLAITESLDIYAKSTNAFTASPITIAINWMATESGDNASCSYNGNSLIININNHIGNASFDGISHELGHGVMSVVDSDTMYRNTMGAIMESYADILGNLMEMIYKLAPTGTAYSGQVNNALWLIEEFRGDQGAIRSMGNPNALGQPYEVGGTYYEKPLADGVAGTNLNDNGGVHTNSGIINNVAYKMMGVLFAGEDGSYDYSTTTLEQYQMMFDVWYNTVQYINDDTTYSSIKGYIRQSLTNYYKAQGEDPTDAEHQDILGKVDQLFDDAKVSEADSYEYKTGDQSEEQSEDESSGNEPAAAARSAVTVSAADASAKTLADTSAETTPDTSAEFTAVTSSETLEELSAADAGKETAADENSKETPQETSATSFAADKDTTATETEAAETSAAVSANETAAEE